MYGMFQRASSFNGDISMWNVSRVQDMYAMFYAASSFNNDISKWDVSSVTNMNSMFFEATSFKRNLCGAAWVHSTASKKGMFTASRGSVLRKVCTFTTTRKDVTRRSLTERELKIVRAPITTPVSTITRPTASTNKIMCPKCGTFKKSGRVSCCAPGGAWFKNCGGAGNRNVNHRWFDGVEACKGKSEEAYDML